MNLEREFFEITRDILHHDAFIQSKYIKHHEGSIYDHSVEVAYKAYRIAKKLGMDYRSVARGGLLHDFFLYDWRTKGNRSLKHMKNSHAVSHPKVALENAKEFFEINDREADIIGKHMFPTTIIPPKYKESWVVTFVDKLCAIQEYKEGVSVKYQWNYRLYRLQQSLSLLTV